MRRGDVWLAEVGGKPHPVGVLHPRRGVDVRVNVSVVEITTHTRGLAVEVPVIDDGARIVADGMTV